jgi:hypothetical protein
MLGHSCPNIPKGLKREASPDETKETKGLFDEIGMPADVQAEILECIC